MNLHNSAALSRRDWLQCAVAISGGILLPRAAVAQTGDAAAVVPLRLGLVTYNWGKEWDVPKLIANCTATGFAGVELRSTHRHGVETAMDASVRAETRSRFEDSAVELMGLGTACEYHSVDPSVVMKNVEESKAFIRLCQDVGGTGIKVRPNGLPAEVPVEKTLVQIGKALNEVARFGADHGVQIRLEVHGHGTQELPHIRTIMDVADHPNNVICWNCNEADLSGAGFDKNYDLVADRLGTVHIHDLRKDTYPWAALFARLRTCDAPGFTGWTLLEEGNVPEDTVAAMRANRQIWERLAKG